MNVVIDDFDWTYIFAALGVEVTLSVLLLACEPYAYPFKRSFNPRGNSTIVRVQCRARLSDCVVAIGL